MWIGCLKVVQALDAGLRHLLSDEVGGGAGTFCVWELFQSKSLLWACGRCDGASVAGLATACQDLRETSEFSRAIFQSLNLQASRVNRLAFDAAMIVGVCSEPLG